MALLFSTAVNSDHSQENTMLFARYEDEGVGKVSYLVWKSLWNNGKDVLGPYVISTGQETTGYRCN